MRTKWLMRLIVIGILLCGCTGCNKKNDLGGWKQANTTSGFCTSSEEGYYFVENEILSFFDFESEKAVPLCSKSGCLHKDRNCSAYLEQFNSMYYWNDKLYTIDSKDAITYSLTKREKDGTSVETILTLAEDEIKKGNTYQYAFSIWSGNYFWYLVTVEDGTSIGINDEYFDLYKHYKLYCFNIETGKEEMVLDNTKGLIELVSADNDKVVYTKWKFIDSYIPIEEACEIMLREDSVREVYSYDLDSQENKKVIEFKGNEVQRLLGVVSNQLIVYELDGSLTLYDLEMGEKETLYKSECSSVVMLTDSQIVFQKANGIDTVFYDLETRKEIKCNLDMEKEFVSFISYADDKYFIHRYTEKIDEDTYTGEKAAFISKKDLEKGEENYKDLYN